MVTTVLLLLRIPGGYWAKRLIKEIIFIIVLILIKLGIPNFLILISLPLVLLRMYLRGKVFFILPGNDPQETNYSQRPHGITV